MTATEPTPAMAESRAAAFLRTASDDEREEVFIALIKELIEINNGGACLIPVSTETEQLGYYVPPKAADARFERYGPKLTPEQQAEFADRLTRLHEAVPVEEAIEDLRRQEMALRAELEQQQSA